MADALAAPAHHRPYEDIQALLTGTLFVALGIVMFNQAGLLTGGTAGLALLLHYATGVEFAPTFFLINLPFYALAWLRMGAAFTLKTFAAVALLSLFAWLLPMGLAFRHLWPPLAAVLGGLLCGAGMLMLFRHHASLGGFNVHGLHAADAVTQSSGDQAEQQPHFKTPDLVQREFGSMAEHPADARDKTGPEHGAQRVKQARKRSVCRRSRPRGGGQSAHKPVQSAGRPIPPRERRRRRSTG